MEPSISVSDPALDEAVWAMGHPGGGRLKRRWLTSNLSG
jgi:hypothetical protein